MRWMGGRESDQVEDQRGIGPGHIAGGGIGVVVLAIVIGLLTGHSRSRFSSCSLRLPERLDGDALRRSPAGRHRGSRGRR